MEFPRVSPESVGVPSQAVLDLLDELYRYGIEMHSFMLLRHGKVFAQGHWKPYNPQTPHAMFSFTKSLTSTAIGFAVQEGLLSLDDRAGGPLPGQDPGGTQREPAKVPGAPPADDGLRPRHRDPQPGAGDRIGLPPSSITPSSTSPAPISSTTPPAPTCSAPSWHGRRGKP